MPCTWAIPAPLCSDTWENASADIQQAAQDFATTMLWAATGRKYGVCPVTVRPCGVRRDGFQWAWWGGEWAGGTWQPYIFNGTWYNCFCGCCSCEPRCQVRLMGPVNSVLQVTIGGVVIDPDTYRVDDEHWLVRTNGECWPFCPDMDTDDGPDVFEVTYGRGLEVPTVLLTAASILADEWAKMCVGDECRLSTRVQSGSRNGMTFEMIDPNMFLSDGLTGITEVDQIILALNPYRQKQRFRIYAPELRVPRMVTSP